MPSRLSSSRHGGSFCKCTHKWKPRQLVTSEPPMMGWFERSRKRSSWIFVAECNVWLVLERLREEKRLQNDDTYDLLVFIVLSSCRELSHYKIDPHQSRCFDSLRFDPAIANDRNSEGKENAICSRHDADVFLLETTFDSSIQILYWFNDTTESEG